MQTLTQGLEALLLAFFTAVIPILWRAGKAYLALQGQAALLLVQQRLGEGAARVAGEIVAELRADPNIEAVTRGMLDRGAMILAERFRDTVRDRGIEPHVLTGMIAGELGKLGVAVRR